MEQSCVFLSHLLSQSDIEYVQQTIIAYNGQITDDITKSNLIIQYFSAYDPSAPQGIPQISIVCYKLMIKKKIDPFKFPYRTKFLHNIYLLSKSFKLHIMDQKLSKHLENLVLEMGGFIDKNNFEYYLTDNQEELTKFDPNKIKIVHHTWISVLQYSKLYVSEDNFVLNGPKNIAKKCQKEAIHSNQKKQSKFEYNTNFIDHAYSIWTKHKHWTYKFLKQQLEYSYDLKDEDPQRFKDVLSTAFARKKALEKNKNPNMLPKFQANTMSKCSNHMWKMCNATGSITRDGIWSDTETENLLIVLKEGYRFSTILNDQEEIDWAKVSDYMPERSGKKCYDRYHYLKVKKDPRLDHLFEDKIETKKDAFNYNPNFMSSFTSAQENDLIAIIDGLLNDGCAVTVNKISSIAKTMYYSPLCLATKALIISKGKLNPDVADENGNINIEKYQEDLTKLLSIATNEPQKIIEEYNIKEFTASNTWVYKFMMRNGLVFRKPHYERRGNIDLREVDRYIMEIFFAIEKYGLEKIINMDETSILNHNMPNKVIGRKGVENIKAKKENINEKESSTFIGSISMDPTVKIPLTIVAKGKTKKSEKKYGITENDEELITHSENGWVTPSVMITYLRWLKQTLGFDEFVLILDVYKSHVTQAVKNEAKKLGIQLIYVPACATGWLQPLDRRVYGVVKKKLAKIEKENPTPANQERWKHITSVMIDIWNEITDDVIEESWKIPGLEKLRLSSKEENEMDSEWIPSSNDEEN